MKLIQKILTSLYMKYGRKKHKYPPSTLIHRKTNSSMILEIEFNWFDENNDPVSIVRDAKNSTRIFSVREEEMREFVEYTGNTDF